MGQINVVRVLLCGILTGVVAFLLQLAVFVFLLRGTEFVRLVEAAGRPKFPPLSFLLYIALGIWAMWLYAAIRPRYGAGAKTAAIAALGLWLLGVIVDLNWVAGRLTQLSFGGLTAPVGWALPVIVAATIAGAWLYKE